MHSISKWTVSNLAISVLITIEITSAMLRIPNRQNFRSVAWEPLIPQGTVRSSVLFTRRLEVLPFCRALCTQLIEFLSCQFVGVRDSSLVFWIAATGRNRITAAASRKTPPSRRLSLMWQIKNCLLECVQKGNKSREHRLVMLPALAHTNDPKIRSGQRGRAASTYPSSLGRKCTAKFSHSWRGRTLKIYTAGRYRENFFVLAYSPTARCTNPHSVTF